MLWIPTTLSEREFWAEKVYGVAHPEIAYPPEMGGQTPRGMYYSWWDDEYLKWRPALSPIWFPWWRDFNFSGRGGSAYIPGYGVSTEEELDTLLNQIIPKLKNFDWANSLKQVWNFIDNAKWWAGVYSGMQPIPADQRETSKTLHQWEYEHYLGPVKYALKYDKVTPTVAICMNAPRRLEPVLFAPGATTRNSLIITLYDGTKIQVPTKGPTEYTGSGGVRDIRHGWWYLSLKEILEIAKLPNVVSIEASDTPYPNVEVYNVAPTAWGKAKQQIYTNYVKYMQSPPPPPPTTQPGTQPSGAQPSGVAVTSKTWTWIAIGGGAILLLVLLARRK